MATKKKRPTDLNKLAFQIVAEATRQEPVKEDPTTKSLAKEKNPAAVALGRLGGLKGGRERAKRLTKEQMVEIAREGAKVRWSKHKKH